MPASASSTTTASWYACRPSRRLSTKSPTSRATSCAMRPCTRSSAAIDEPRAAQALERFFIARAALRLAHDRAVPREAELVQRAQDLVFGAGDRARRIDVLDPQVPFAACGAGIEPARERRGE